MRVTSASYSQHCWLCRVIGSCPMRQQRRENFLAQIQLDSGPSCPSLCSILLGSGGGFFSFSFFSISSVGCALKCSKQASLGKFLDSDQICFLLHSAEVVMHICLSVVRSHYVEYRNAAVSHRVPPHNRKVVRRSEDRFHASCPRWAVTTETLAGTGSKTRHLCIKRVMGTVLSKIR